MTDGSIRTLRATHNSESQSAHADDANMLARQTRTSESIPASASGTSGLTEVARKYQNNLGDRELTVNTLCLHNMGSFCFSYSISLFPALIHHFGRLLSLSLLTLFMPLYSLSCSLGLVKVKKNPHTDRNTYMCETSSGSLGVTA